LRALVGFGESAGHPLARFLKPGFKHCFCALLTDRDLWILVDGLAGVPTVRYLTAVDGFDLAAFWREKGYTVVETEQRTRPLRAPMVHANCVGLVKAMLCIRAPLALTPYRLYLHLTKGKGS
jgi:hypothetical protein